MLLFFLLLVLSAVNIDGAEEGEICTENGVTGICTDLKKCPGAVQDIKNRKRPEICQFKGKTDIVVCCLDNALASSGDYVTTAKAPTSTQTQKVPQIAGDIYDEFKDDICDPIPPSLTANKTGQKAFDKCIEYQQLVYPCKKSPSLIGEMVRENKCYHSFNELIIGVTQARRHEFPHAALLGFGNDLKKLDWLCGGALISDRYILTAAHCTSSRERGSVTYAALPQADRADIDPQRIYKIKRIIRHPEFKPPRTYHDIALLELETPLALDSLTVPACLYTSDSVADSTRVISTTWNTNDILNTNVTWLQKIYLSKYSSADCLKMYPENRKGKFNETTQICYGDQTSSKDICQDDGGNPLVLENRKLACMYTIIGVASYGKGCFNHSPGVYTKVEPYVTWIESVVWP